MKKMRVKSMLAVMLAAAMLIGCGAKTEGTTSEDTSNEEASKEDDKQKELEQMVDKAVGQYMQEKHRYEELTGETYYEDGEEVQYTHLVNIDEESQVIQWSMVTDGTEIKEFYQKDGEDTWSYVADFDGTYLKHKSTPNDGETAYDSYATESAFDKDLYERVEYEDAGEEKYEGKDAIKVKVTGYHKMPAEDTPTMTREQAIEELGATEEIVSAVEGFSECLDKYVEAYNYNNSLPYFNSDKSEIIFWIEKETNQLLYQETVICSDPEIEAKWVEATNTMNDYDSKSFEVTMIVENMNYGWSLEEAAAIARDNMVDMEANDFEPYVQKPREKSVEKIKYFIGDACPAQDPLPTEYKEITQEQYMNGEW